MATAISKFKSETLKEFHKKKSFVNEQRDTLLHRNDSVIQTERAEFSKLFSKVMKLPEVGSIFVLLTKLYDIYFGKNFRIRKKHRNDFATWVEKVLKLLYQVVPNESEENLVHSNPNWEKIFHKCSFNCPPDYMKAFSAKNVQNVINLLLEYLTIAQEGDGCEISDITFILSLVKYFEIHKLDALSCLIGLKASKEVVEEIKKFAETNLSEEADLKQRYLSFLRKLDSWAAIEDPLTLSEQVREFVWEVRGTKSLAPGSVILAEIERDSYIFARTTGEYSGNIISVYTSPFPESMCTLQIEKVFPLRGTVEVCIRNYVHTELEKLIISPIDVLYQEQMAKVENFVSNFLKTKNIDLELIKKANFNECSITELKLLKHAQRTLEGIKQNPPNNEITKLQLQLKEKVAFIHENQHKIPFLYTPTVHSTLLQLSSFHIRYFVNNNITRLIGVCYSALDQLKLQKRELMNGTRKDILSSWWLEEIERTVISFLTKLGYNFSAIPDNYTEEPPSDIETVYKNLSITQEVLKKDDPHGLSTITQKMKDLIYPKINVFMTDAKIALLEQFEVDLNLDHFTASMAEELFEKSKNKIKDQMVINWIDDIIKDISYLEQMIALENPSEDTKKSLHIVPVTGLVLGVVCRLQNECKTVLDFWDIPTDTPKSVTTLLNQNDIESDSSRSSWKRTESRPKHPVRRQFLQPNNETTNSNDGENPSNNIPQLNNNAVNNNNNNNNNNNRNNFNINRGNFINNNNNININNNNRNANSTPNPNSFLKQRTLSVNNITLSSGSLRTSSDSNTPSFQSVTTVTPTIHQAVIQGDLATIRMLLSSQPELLNSVNDDGCTPLILSCKHFNFNICNEFLVKDDVKVDKTDYQGNTALNYIVTNTMKIEEIKIVHIVTIILAKLLISQNYGTKGSFDPLFLQSLENTMKICAEKNNYIIPKIFLQSIPFLGENLRCFATAIQNHSHEYLSAITKACINVKKMVSSIKLEDYENHLCCSDALHLNRYEFQCIFNPQSASPSSWQRKASISKGNPRLFTVGRKGSSSPIYRSPSSE